MLLFVGLRHLDAASVADLVVDPGGGLVDGDQDEDVGGGYDEHREDIQANVQQGD